MKLYLGLTENSPPYLPRVFGESDSKLVDLNLAYAAYLERVQGVRAHSYELAAFYFPENIMSFLQRGEAALQALAEVDSFIRKNSVRDLRGPAGEKVVYDRNEIRILPPFQRPEKVSSSAFPTRPVLKPCPKLKFLLGFTNFPRPW